jgi:hypothetical protein
LLYPGTYRQDEAHYSHCGDNKVCREQYNSKRVNREEAVVGDKENRKDAKSREQRYRFLVSALE